jgi:hypothetical protein
VSLAVGAVLLGLGTSCAKKVDRFTLDRVVERAMPVPDLGQVCALGESLNHAIAALTSAKRPARKALLIAETVSGMCAQLETQQADLDAVRARRNLGPLGDGRKNEIRDARIRAQRLHGTAAARFDRGFAHLEAEYGPIGGDTCPNVKEKDEVAYMVGLVAGVLSLLHDKASGNMVGVPLDTINRVGRGASCLDDERWWMTPTALQAAAWATVPGSAPDGVDPMVELEKAAVEGEKSGVRVARALQVVIAVNAGHDEVAATALAAHAKSIAEVPADPAWQLLDAYAMLLSQHESDLIWTSKVGHRTPTFGELPVEESTTDPGPDLFEGADPFGADPFAEPAPTDETPEEETSP